jgi:hypothetical protein
MGAFVHAAVAAAIVAALGAVAAPVAARAEPVGSATAIIPAAYEQAPQGTRSELKLSDPVIRNAALATGDKGALEVTFLDGSRLTMGGNSTLVVDDYVYSGPGGAGKQTLRYTRGLFRFISGTIPKDQVKVDTPTVTIGIRGTDFRTRVFDDGSTTISVDEHSIEIFSKETGQSIVLSAGQKIHFDNHGIPGGIGQGKIEGCE